MPRLLGARRAGPANNPLQNILSRFRGAGDVVAIHCSNNFAATQTWEVYQRLKDDVYWRIKYEATPAVGSSYLRVAAANFRTYYRAIHRSTTPQMTWDAAWTSSAAETYVGGLTYYTNTTDKWIQFVSEAGASKVGVIVSGGANGGVALVTIDGDKTAANLLPTAQALVDAGTLPATVLVANGGTLNPTDRVLDGYNYPYTTLQGLMSAGVAAIADNLVGAHTIRLTVTGYKNVASTGVYVNLQGFFENGPTLTPFAPTSTVASFWVSIVAMMSQVPVWEVSWSNIPTGATNSQWVGHSDPLSLEVKVAPSVKVDGADISPPVAARIEQTFVGARTVAITQQCSVVHPEIGGGATEIGVWDAVYTLDALAGYTIAHSLAWSTTGVAAGYPCMLTVDAPTYDRCKSLDSGNVTLVANDDSHNAATKQGLVLAWDHDGYQAALMHIPNLGETVDCWADSTNYLYFLDWSGGTWKKAYANRFTTWKAYDAATVWASRANYRAGWFYDGAENNW
jgi:hypothetical protein